MTLETNRLQIRPITPEDRNEIFEYRSDQEINKYQGWIPKTIDDVDTFIGKVSKKINEPYTWFQFVVVEKASQKIVGDLGIHFFDSENKQLEIGCTLNKDFQSTYNSFPINKSR